MLTDFGEFHFVISLDEIRRRKAAFDRLAVSTIIAASVFSADLIVAYVSEATLGIFILVLFFIISRVTLASLFSRFTRTTWTISDKSLMRKDERSQEDYPLQQVRRLRVKRTVAGGIREIRVWLDGGRSIYINGIENFEAFRENLFSRIPQADKSGELNEAFDFDHPLFYIFLGIVFGLSFALVVRVALSVTDLDMQYVNAALGIYSIVLGSYWLNAKPVSGRYGKRSTISDYVVGLSIIVLGAGAALAVLFQ